MSAGWKRTVHGDASTENVPITYERGGWRIVKDFYADGPTMFTYRIYSPRGLFLAETRTLAAAKRYVDRSQPIGSGS